MRQSQRDGRDQRGGSLFVALALQGHQKQNQGLAIARNREYGCQPQRLYFPVKYLLHDDSFQERPQPRCIDRWRYADEFPLPNSGRQQRKKHHKKGVSLNEKINASGNHDRDIPSRHFLEAADRVAHSRRHSQYGNHFQGHDRRVSQQKLCGREYLCCGFGRYQSRRIRSYHLKLIQSTQIHNCPC